MWRFQDKAKVWADANIVKLVLITNDTETETRLSKNSSAWSRLATPVIVDDLRRHEALAFLSAPYLNEEDQPAAGDGKNHHLKSPNTGKTMDAGLAEQIVELVGGRILHLIAMKRDWLYGISFDDSANELTSREREQLLQVLASEC